MPLTSSGPAPKRDVFGYGEMSGRFDDVPSAEPDRGRGIWPADEGPAPDIDLTPYSEDALAVAWCNRHSAIYKFTAGMDWMHDRGARWAPDDLLTRFDRSKLLCREVAAKATEVDDKLAPLARKITSAACISAVVTLARSDPRMSLGADQWDSDLMALNTPAGIVDLRTGSVRPRAGDFVTQIANVSPDSTAPCQVWHQFLKDVFCDDEDVIEFVQRMCGYFMTGSVEEQKIFFAWGSGGNGKSVFIDLIERIIGTYATRLPSEALMTSKNERHPTEIAMLRSKRLAISSELEEGAYWAESKLKSLTGDATNQARFMRGDFFEFKQTQKHLIIGNYKPRLRGGDAALARRFVLIPFNATFNGEKRDLRIVEKLWAEAPAILDWMIRGAVMWRAGGLQVPDSISSASAEYMADNDDIAIWQAECCVFAPENQTKASTLYESFSTWLKSRGQHAPSLRVWGERMATDKRITKKISAGVKYIGVRLTQDETDRVYQLQRGRI